MELYLATRALYLNALGLLYLRGTLDGDLQDPILVESMDLAFVHPFGHRQAAVALKCHDVGITRSESIYVRFIQEANRNRCIAVDHGPVSQLPVLVQKV